MRSLFCFFTVCLAAAHAYYDCPSGYSFASFANNLQYCYKVYTTFYDRQQAVSRCAQDGATLATITSADVNQVLVNADQVTGSLTFGLSCRDSYNCAFDDGTPFNLTTSYNNFAGGQIQTNYGECVALQTLGAGQGTWSNVPCSMYGSFICHYNPNSLISQQSGCNSLTLLTRNGYDLKITSPHYPMNYDNYQTCSYFINSNQGKGLNITFNDFYVETGYDNVRIFSGGSTNNVTFLGMYTGQLGTFTVLVPNQEALITFTTDGSTVYRGFAANVGYYYY